MRSSLVFSILSSGVYAQMGGMGLAGILMGKLDNSPEGQCHQISLFTNVINSVSDPKIKDAFTGGDATKAAMGDAIVGMLNQKLDPIKANQSVVDGCQATIATDNEVFDCLELQQVDKMNALIANQTALDAVTKGNAAKQDMLKKIAAALGDKVTVIRNNQPASDFCKANVDMRCIQQKIMTRFTQLASDDAALNAHFNNNATQVQKFKDGAAKAQTKLDEQKKDQALTDVCAKMPNTLPINIDSVNLDDLPKSNGIPAMRPML